MDDLSICKRIAEVSSEYVSDGDIIISEDDYPYRHYRNPLDDDALCFQLMVKYKAFPEGTGDDTHRACVCNWQGKPEYYRATAETLNKAICLAIIEANKELVKCGN